MPFSLSPLLPSSCGVRLLLWSSVHCPAPPTPGSFPHRALYCSWSIQRYQNDSITPNMAPKRRTQLCQMQQRPPAACSGTFCSFVMTASSLCFLMKDTQRHRLHLSCLQEDSKWTLSRCLEPKPQAATASILKVTDFILVVLKTCQAFHTPTGAANKSAVVSGTDVCCRSFFFP